MHYKQMIFSQGATSHQTADWTLTNSGGLGGTLEQTEQIRRYKGNSVSIIS